MHNLDQLAAQKAQQIVKDAVSAKELDILATKTLGVLQENGVYAAALFLESRGKKEQELAQNIEQKLFELPQKAIQIQIQSLQDIVDRIAGDLDTLLLVKQLWEQTLIYVRYGAKARQQQGAPTSAQRS